jgi:hypothetical protein
MDNLTSPALKAAYEAYTAGKMHLNDMTPVEILDLITDAAKENIKEPSDSYRKFFKDLLIARDSKTE